MTLLGIGGFPASDPLNLGMMGMHGEAWVNAAIQDADLLIACGMRFDDRVTGNLKTYAPRRARSTSTSTRRRSARTSRSTSASSPIWRRRSRRSRPHVARGDRRAWRGHIACPQGRRRGARHQEPAGRWPPVCRARDARPVARRRAAARVVVTDVGQHQMWEAQYYHHDTPRSLITSGGLGTMGFALPAAIGAKIARPDAEVWVVVGDGGFQMTLCELATIAQERLKINIAHHQQRLSRHGAAVAGVLLRAPLRRDAAAQPRLRAARRGVRLAGAVGHVAAAQVDPGHRTPRASDDRRGAHRLPRRAGGLGVPDGAGRRRSARDDSPAVGDRGNGDATHREPPTADWL